MATQLPGVKIAMVPKGLFDASTAYAFLDVVNYGNAAYVCKSLTGAVAGSWNASKWQKLCESSPTLTPQGPYDATASYSYLDVVSYLGALYADIYTADSITGIAPTDTAKWKQLLPNPGQISDGGDSGDFS